MDYRTRAVSPLDYYPVVGYLWGWWPIDEAEGTTIHNIATVPNKLPDLISYGGSWGLGGFMVSTPLNPCHILWQSSTSVGDTTSSDTMSVFCRATPWASSDYYEGLFGLSQYPDETNLIETNLGAYLRGPAYGDNIYFAGTFNAIITFGSDTLGKAMFENRWVFIFITRENGTHADFHIVYDNGTKYVKTKVTAATSSNPIKRICIYRWYHPISGWNQWYGSLGDMMFFRSLDVTVDDFKSVYNALRHRYGMAAASGW